MNATTTHALSEALERIQALHPDWRFGQLVCNVATEAGEDAPAHVWDVGDEAMLAAALKHLARHEAASRPSERQAG